MADDTVHQLRYSISALTARSVTIYPTRAAVVRDIADVAIKVNPFHSLPRCEG